LIAKLRFQAAQIGVCAPLQKRHRILAQFFQRESKLLFSLRRISIGDRYPGLQAVRLSYVFVGAVRLRGF